jgi:hypothetical protein
MFITPITPSIPGNYTNRVKTATELLVGFEMGSLALQNPTGGLLQQLWMVVCADGKNIYVQAPNNPTSPIFILQDQNITEVDLAFDQNMFPFVTYVSNSLIKFYWYDPVSQQFVVSTILELAQSPRCTLDDKRAFNVSNSDIVLLYVNMLTEQLCYRIQRERYATEHVISSATLTSHLRCVNFADNLRLQWTVDDYTQNVLQTPHAGLANYTRPISITGAYIT